MPNTPPTKTTPQNERAGLAPEWLNLPKRKCLWCAKTFQPLRPEQKFHTPECRLAFHRDGGEWPKLMNNVNRLVRKEVSDTVVLIREENELLKFKMGQLEEAVARLAGQIKRRR